MPKETTEIERTNPMTNEQLYVFVLGLLSEISTAVENSRNAIAATRNTVVETHRRHIPTVDCSRFLCQKESHYEDFHIELPDPVSELEHISIVLNDIEKRVSALALNEG